ncbi:hypothetical protein BC943DRAFT_165851 [Umbelopsis sp. AD052]|nr:hypothetical protein BC943DRAFT_165851 [Umbelopsis sp. AD052]
MKIKKVLSVVVLVFSHGPFWPPQAAPILARAGMAQVKPSADQFDPSSSFIFIAGAEALLVVARKSNLWFQRMTSRKPVTLTPIAKHFTPIAYRLAFILVFLPLVNKYEVEANCPRPTLRYRYCIIHIALS